MASVVDAQTRTQTRTPIRVVLIDDSAEIREVLRLALHRGEEFTVVAEAADGRAGLAAVDAHQPDLVLLDIAMPVMDGLQALPLIRRASPPSIVVILTGYPECSIVLSALELGAHGFIRKGGSMPDLLAHIREVLDYRLQVAAHVAARETSRRQI